MKIALYSPYIPEHTGGGEAYLMRVAWELSKNHQVVVACGNHRVNSRELQKKYQDFTHFDLSKVEFVSSPLREGNVIQKMSWSRQFDVMYYVTDGSFFLSAARKNVVHIQIPFTNPLSVATRVKLLSWPIRTSNSEFTKSIIEKKWQIPVQFVHQPAIEVAHIAQPVREKKPVILHVGRFFRQLHSKRQDVLVSMFKELCEQHKQLSQGWELHLIGPVEDADFADQVAHQANGWPIRIYHEVSRSALISAYQEASIYWHATGVGSNPDLEPAKQEHFGISTLEAMAAGCVPVVYAQGGQPEVLGTQLAAWGWQTPSEALIKTKKLIESASLRQELSHVARDRAQHFDGREFRRILEEVIHA